MKPYEITLRLLIFANNEEEARELFQEKLDELDYSDDDIEIEET